MIYLQKTDTPTIQSLSKLTDDQPFRNNKKKKSTHHA